MNSAVKNILKIFAVGLAATVVRIIGQLSIPSGEQTVLPPSVFAKNGTMPLAFTVYGVFAYSLIASLFLLIRGRMSGSGFAGAEIWPFLLRCVDLVSFGAPAPCGGYGSVTYPLADSLALVVRACCLWAVGGSRASGPPEESTIPCSSDAGRSCLLPCRTDDTIPHL